MSTCICADVFAVNDVSDVALYIRVAYIGVVRAEIEMTYQEFLASIDNSQAGTDDFGNLAWHIDCSVMANVETDDEAEWISQGRMILDDWRGFYPQLRIES